MKQDKQPSKKRKLGETGFDIPDPVPKRFNKVFKLNNDRGEYNLNVKIGRNKMATISVTEPKRARVLSKNEV